MISKSCNQYLWRLQRLFFFLCFLYIKYMCIYIYFTCSINIWAYLTICKPHFDVFGWNCINFFFNSLFMFIIVHMFMYIIIFYSYNIIVICAQMNGFLFHYQFSFCFISSRNFSLFHSRDIEIFSFFKKICKKLLFIFLFKYLWRLKISAKQIEIYFSLGFSFTW